ncbi:MAG TPA: protein-methionine-sulfoxide reductase heme-binding subunit MsrQ [Roseiflexaceae bacterium]
MARPVAWLEPGVIAGALVPLAAIALRAGLNKLGADPIAKVENELGLTALILLVTSLACTPASRLLGWTWAIRIRRTLGLLAFMYASLHFLTYLFLDQGVDLGAIAADIVKRPFITAGFSALLLLTPLAFTSTKASIRRLGFRRWQRVHQLTYVAGILAIVHFIWRVKLDITQPAVYGWILGALLLIRIAIWLRQNRTANKSSPAR